MNSRSVSGHDVETDTGAGMTILYEETCRQIHNTGSVAGLQAASIGCIMKKHIPAHNVILG